ncbi:RNA 2'-phosphotransferase [Kaarinaea lacus]
MKRGELTQLSKFLSYVLRHKPDAIGLRLDEHGWVSIDELIEKARLHNKAFDRETIRTIVDQDAKNRYSVSVDQQRIRANQGHSIVVDLQLAPQTPLEILYHGTSEKNLTSIKKYGLVKQQRHHVHLSADESTARQVGSRYGKPVILIIKALHMHKAGCDFYLSDNKVWLTDFVPVEFIRFPKL